jgi:hypothetical protein
MTRNLHPREESIRVQVLARCRTWLRVALGWLSTGIAMMPGIAAIEWRWSHPEPHGNNLSDMVYRDGVYVHVTDHGGVYISTNRVMWGRGSTPTLKDLRAAAFLGTRFLATGEEGTVLWSDDLLRFESGTVSPETTDWLEGVATSDTLAVAVGDNGAIFRSADGKSWNRVAAGVFSKWLFGVAHGEGVFVLVGEGGLIASSADGENWTVRNSGVTEDLTRVVYGGGRFFAVGDAGMVVTSVNGSSWSQDGRTGSPGSLATAAVGSRDRLVAGELALLLRTPLSVWEDQLSSSSPAPAPEWDYAASVWDGTRYLVGGRTGVLVESFRTNAPPFQDETFWLRQDESPRNWLWDATWIGGAYLAVGDQATVLSSLSGARWELESVPEEAEGRVLYGVGGSPETALAVGEGGLMLRSSGGYTNVVTAHEVVVGGVTNVVWTTNRVSLMGLVWELIEPRPTTNTLQGIAWDGTRYVVSGAGGTLLTGTSPNAWSSTVASGREFLSSVATAGGQWVASGARGALYVSTDGLNWNRQNSGSSNWIYRVAYVGAEWVAVGERGLILTSPDALQWVPRESGTTAWLTAIGSVGGATYVCGTQGTVLRSTNRVDWASVPTLTGKALQGMASRGPQLVVAGAEGVVLRAIAEPTAQAVQITDYRLFHQGTSAVEALVFEGVTEQRFRWESTEAIPDWELEAELELDLNGQRVAGRTTRGARRFHQTAIRP